MHVASRDTRDAYAHKVTITFEASELGLIGLDMSSYNGRASSDGEIVNAIITAFKTNRQATEIAIRDYQVARIMRDSIERLNNWMDNAAAVAAGGLVPDGTVLAAGRSDK